MSASVYGLLTRRPSAWRSVSSARLGTPRVIEALAQADVAVVEADDAKAARDQQRDEVLVPAEQLHAQAHDEQQRLAVRRAVVFDLEADAVGGELHRCGAGPVSPPPASASGSAVRKNQRRAPRTSNGCHCADRLRQPVGDRVERERIHAHADMAGAAPRCSRPAARASLMLQRHATMPSLRE